MPITTIGESKNERIVLLYLPALPSQDDERISMEYIAHLDGVDRVGGLIDLYIKDGRLIVNVHSHDEAVQILIDYFPAKNRKDNDHDE